MLTINKSSVILSLSEKDAIPPNAAWESISPVLLDKWLCLYPLHERHLKEVLYSNGKINAIVEPHDIEYSTIKVDYYTASQILLMSSQLSYALAGASIKDEQFGRLPSELYSTFIERLLAAEIYYTNFQIRFKRKVENFAPHKITIMFKLVKNIRGLLYVASFLDFANGSAKAQISLIMPLDSKG
jgi:hypothetical protein